VPCDESHQALASALLAWSQHILFAAKGVFTSTQFQAQWCARQQASVLPVTYHHLVFTLPQALNPWLQLHPKTLYDVLFASVWATLRAFGADPKRLGGQLGLTAVLHTWGETLSQHVHLHCLVPGGALDSNGQWQRAKSTYLFPVRALARHFRGGFVRRLRQAINDGALERITDTRQIDTLLDTLMAKDWVVYSKPCLTHTASVIDYLGRYSHRIALTDRRILALDPEGAQLAYKDYRDGARKVLTLAGEELLRRFLLHVLPKGFMRIRHFGFLANRCRQQRLAQIRAALDATAPDEETAGLEEHSPFDGYPCPMCPYGRLRVVAELPAQRIEGG